VARLIIVGRDPAAAEGYVRHASLRGVAPMVSIVPDDREIFRWYSAADVCVLLSWYDPCSRVVLEATRWGVPSITTEFNGAAEIIKRGCGMVVPSPSNRDAVAAAMEAMSDDKRRSEMSQNCLAIAPSLSMKRHVDELIKIYQEVR
jgi:UDP-glucose:(heptosyl)LPS alpha-1,3-glucosyltransferase